MTLPNPSASAAGDLFGGKEPVWFGPNAVLFPGFAEDEAAKLFADMIVLAERSPFRHQVTPGGFEMSVAATNCGRLGWITDKSGYRYGPIDPVTQSPWPEMPVSFQETAVRAGVKAGYDFEPDACLINRYSPGARLSLHQDRSERDMAHPVVTVSLGLPATFQWGGAKRTDRTTTMPLHHGDVVVWGGADRLRFHGVKELPDGEHPMTGRTRYSLTFRYAA